jgi:hypothetical protein
MLDPIHGSHAECLDARPIKSGVERCVHLAWLPFLLSLRPLIFLSPISSQAFTLRLLNMLVWHQFVTYSLIIVTFFLTAPRPSHALPVIPQPVPSITHPSERICPDDGLPPCVCGGRLSLLGHFWGPYRRRCMHIPDGVHLMFPDHDSSTDLVMVSHLFFHWR